jgi:hypothetical protein
MDESRMARRERDGDASGHEDALSGADDDVDP